MQQKRLDQKEYYLSRRQYCSIEFMNEAPEIVCDLLYYMAGFVHYRTNFMSQESYAQMLHCQVT